MMEGSGWAFGLRMRTHARYLRYVLTHKWRVLRCGRRLGVPLWQLLMHDMSKFSGEEWGPYARWFYTRAPDGQTWYAVYKELQADTWSHVPEPWLSARHLKADFDEAWTHHWQHNEHHWEFWANGLNAPLEMPNLVAREMVADWSAAGMDKGFLPVKEWYAANRDRIRLHPATRVLVEALLFV